MIWFVTSRFGLLTNEDGFVGSARFVVRGESVVSMVGVGEPMLLNSETSSVKMCASIVSIDGPAGNHFGLGAAAACASGIEGCVKLWESGPDRLVSENPTARRIISLTEDALALSFKS